MPTTAQQTLTIEELQTRTQQRVGTSEWIVIDQERIDSFARVTGDFQFIHVDPERAARETPFGGTVAHGMLTLSLIAGMSQSALPIIRDRRMSLNYGFDRVRFLSPVKVGAQVRVLYDLHGVELRSHGEYLVKYDVSVEIRGEEKLALVARSIALVFV